MFVELQGRVIQGQWIPHTRLALKFTCDGSPEDWKKPVVLEAESIAISFPVFQTPSANAMQFLT